ncbi:MAG TPA: hypothetical protein VEY92_08500 [Pseudoxanthomonas sp.]|nr:hypothetical protein [Pseudoxanthomonas sp.]
MSGIRQFESGATRDQNLDKFDYTGFLCPLVLERFAAYMHKHRIQVDGSLRAADNWKKGIPFSAYAESEWRHHLDFQKAHGGLPAPDIEESLCAIIFNAQGYLHELLKSKAPVAPGAGVEGDELDATIWNISPASGPILPVPYNDNHALQYSVSTTPAGAQSGEVIEPELYFARATLDNDAIELHSTSPLDIIDVTRTAYQGKNYSSNSDGS